MKGKEEIIIEDHEAFGALIERVPGWLDRPIEHLVKMHAVGSVYVATHRAILGKIKSGQIVLAEEDRRVRLKEGQVVGEALLDVEAKIGQLLPSSEEAEHGMVETSTGRARYQRPEGITHRRAQAARAIASHPETVAAVKQEAIDNEDIPTKTAVLTRIKLDKAKAARAAYKPGGTEEERKEIKEIVAQGEAATYLSKLHSIVIMLSASVPKDGWTEASFAEAQAMVAIIRKRLEDWK